MNTKKPTVVLSLASMALSWGLILLLASCSPATQTFECTDVADKSNVLSFSKKNNAAVLSSMEMQFCQKDGNVSTYSDGPAGCKSLLELSKVGGTRIYFDDVVYTLEEKTFVGNGSFYRSFKCKKTQS